MSSVQNSRALWRERRMAMEQRKQRSTVMGWRRYNWLRPLTGTIKAMTAFFGASDRGRRNALDLQITRLDIPCVGLPHVYDGYTILHLSDLHLEALPELVSILRHKLADIVADLVVLTGDYETFHEGESEQAANLLGRALSMSTARDGIYGILGNHDSHHIVDLLEARGIRMLVNECATIYRDGHPLHLVGVDDVHSYFTQAAIQTLIQAPAGTRIALVHTPDLATLAAEQGYALYLTGHTHGGQFCLPSGQPLVTMLDTHDHLAAGAWNVGTMVGYTSRGIGVGNIPMRFNCRGEIVLVRLMRVES